MSEVFDMLHYASVSVSVSVFVFVTISVLYFDTAYTITSIHDVM